MRLGLIGYGSIVRQMLEALTRTLDRPLDCIVCLARPDGVARAQALMDSLGADFVKSRLVVADATRLLNAKPDFVAEAAGHEALAEHGAAVLAAGCDLIITSAGALADDALRARLDQAATKGAAQYSLCPGAIGGLDILAAAKRAGLREVTYTSRKPPAAWRGTPAEKLVDLETLREARVFFQGDARVAARDYPQNANVAATLALCGAGFDRTRVRLIADPDATRNTHQISILSECGDIEIQIAGRPSPDNPKTSMTTGFALAAQIEDRLKGRPKR